MYLWEKVWQKEVYADDETQETHGGMFGMGEPNTAFAQYFIGNSHHATKGGGQILVCVEGNGWYQEEGKPAQSLKPGDVVTIPANVKHWHGAQKDSWFSHLAVEVPGEDTSNEWCEPVNDELYNKLVCE